MSDDDLAFQHQLDALKQSNPLPIIAERYGLDLKPSGRNFISRCPFHDDRNPSFSIFLAQAGEWAFFCHSASCGVGGDLFRFVGLMEIGPAYSGSGSDFVTVLDRLGGGEFHHSPRLTSEDLLSRAADRPEIDGQVKELWDVALNVAHQLLRREERILAYLEQRGFDMDILRQWRFGWWPSPTGEISPVIGALLAAGYRYQQMIHARLLRSSSFNSSYYEFFAGNRHLSGRIICADLDSARRPAYLLARVLPWEDDGKTAKYLGPPEFAKPVLGIDSLPRNDEPVALVEGFWNMITLRKWGFASVAVSGANLSSEQTAALLGLKRPLVPVRDMDLPGKEGVVPGLEALRSWQKALPDLPDGIELPQELEGRRIKDVNDLDQHPEGKLIFKRLAARWKLKMKKQ